MVNTADAFEACLNQGFVLVDGDYRDELELIRIERLPGSPSNDGGEAFSLIFQSRNSPPLEQRIYSLTNPEMGELQIFIVPIAEDESGVRYEAVFN